jgi:hypothetical protein
VIEDCDAPGDETLDDDALLSRCRMRINEDFMATTESSPSGHKDDVKLPQFRSVILLNN